MADHDNLTDEAAPLPQNPGACAVTNEIEVMSDGDGLAVIGEANAVDAFLTSNGLVGTDLGLSRLVGRATFGAAALAQAGSIAAEQSGRWLKLTDESARAMKTLPMVKNATTGNLHATLRATNGQFTKNLQFVPAAAAVAPPALLAMSAAMMSQMALQQSIDELGEYLAVIDQKVDDILRAQKDAVLADMIGVDLLIEEAMAVREDVGRVSEITWSKVQSAGFTIARTEAYALRQIDALAEKVETAKVGEVANAAKDAEPKVKEWLAVIAHCVQLQDALTVLELDRVLDGEPEDLDRHRLGLRSAREKRLSAIHRTTELLLERMNATIRRANSKVLLSPLAARSAVTSSNHVVTDVLQFQTALEIEDGHDSASVKRWRTAAGEMRDKVIETGVGGANAAKQFGDDTVVHVRSGAGRLSGGVRAFREAVRKDTPTPADSRQEEQELRKGGEE
ncbi:hypothetical protein NLU66_04170 [Brachybacterium sp. NBEC-018]|uniref:hypothetical protein n=1 Tax=Brachybacterium sp. NBEC-018 TaxID=2996004 RepID=UPI002174D636|nr:hypothetical protein [Brachybacterium sp. NBEC-018]UVY84800.1 hypothetical protein NLU66_04170 [Brachybacterium sp. NBEC-018]